ncbi:hypothetical protein ACFQ05_22220 [Amycolatopsis umgeniensis]|uniref:Carbamoylphosphate synthase large subunit n=2 Tax=Amycolatopsis umgeniensis TaxID=336628 RepID=A0A841AUW6_9PSEU|nr:hypothetical protein [Amycolatopsis umgeniensis]MBB5849918.1 carbamoylphosphate synthase large subunit [Amycolatopsis umgeniensis]
MPRRPEPRSVLVIGSGPIVLGQATPACQALKAAGLRITVVDGNLATTTTDPGFADATYLEPVDPSTVEKIIARERPDALLPTLGGQAALDTAVALSESGALARYGVELIGTSIDAILAGENHEEFARIVKRVGAEVLPVASVAGWRKCELELLRDHDDKMAVACSTGEFEPRMRDVAVMVAQAVGVGPGGCTLRFAVDPRDGRPVVTGFDPRVARSGVLAVELAVGRTLDDLGSEPVLDQPAVPEAPAPVERFPGGEIEVVALYDGHELYVGGVVERFESAWVLPPVTLGRADLARIRESTRVPAESIGLLNVRYALTSGELSILDAKPGAGGTVPFVSKATGVPLIEAAARVNLGARIADLRTEGLLPSFGDGGSVRIAAKQGAVMGIGSTFGSAYAKTQAASSNPLPTKGQVFVSFAGRDNRAMVFPVKALADMGFEILASEGTGSVLRRLGVPVTIPRRSSLVDLVLAGEVVLVVDAQAGHEIRVAAAARGIPFFTTVRGLAAAVQGIEAVSRGRMDVVSLQEHIARLRDVPRP